MKGKKEVFGDFNRSFWVTLFEGPKLFNFFKGWHLKKSLGNPGQKVVKIISNSVIGNQIILIANTWRRLQTL